LHYGFADFALKYAAELIKCRQPRMARMVWRSATRIGVTFG
jgi:hypothetical protein